MGRAWRAAVAVWCCVAAVAANEPPRFEANMDYHVISENTPVGKEVYTLKGVDPEGSALLYGLVGTDVLQVNPRSGVVSVQKRIDHEVTTQLKLSVTLEDRVEGGENNKVSVPITIIVVDENDNPPQLQPALYEAEVREDAAVGSTVVARIEATDPDLVGENLNVTCDPQNSSEGACDLVSVVSREATSQKYVGSLILQSPLELAAAAPPQIAVSLSVTDEVHQSAGRVLVRVQDVQNRPPEFSGSRTAVVDEAAPIGTAALTLLASDGDRGAAREVHFELVDNPGEFFSLDEETGVLSTAKRLDRESDLVRGGNIHLTVKAVEVDGGRRLRGPLTEASTDVTITVRDANDEPPRFSQQEYSTTISENLRDGTPLPGLNILVTDADVGVSSAYTVRLLDGAAGPFSVEPAGGRGSSAHSVRLARGPLDYENPNQRKFILLLVAEESGTQERLATTSTVTVTVSDLNDNPPRFSQDAYVAQVSEMSAPGTIITTVSAGDRDSGLFGQEGIVYKLSGAGSERFAIDPRTGTVLVAPCNTPGSAPCIDYETRRDYFLTVEATDEAGEGLSSSVPLKIVTLDANDSEPKFARPSYAAAIREGARRFDPPLLVQADDRDVTSQLTYSLPEGGVFRIDPGTGEVTVNKTEGIDLADVQGQEMVSLLVDVTDGMHTMSVPLEVTVIDTNNNQPTFSKPVYQAVLPETVPIGTVVERVSARDKDTGANALVRYRLQRGAYGQFSVDPESGVVTLTGRLDHERRDSYSIDVLAVDDGSPAQTGTATLSVMVIDSNDKSPHFTPNAQRAEVSEDASVGSRFYQLSAVDPDVASPEDLVFSLVEAESAVSENGKPVDRPNRDYKGFFNVSSDGWVSVAEPLRRERAAVVTLAVMVTDTSAVPPQESTGRLLVTIVDVNEFAPEFAPPWTADRPTLSYQLREELVPGTVFGRVRATDRDTRVSRYLAEGNGTDLVDVDPVTGELSVRARVDYESVTRLELDVTAFDTGVPQRNSTAHLVIGVVNVNDMTPEFEQEVYHASVEEHSPAGTELVRVNATDEDSGMYGEVSYAIPGDLSEEFSVDTDGVVRLATANLDRERRQRVLLTVVALDGGPDQGRRSASALVNITVTDINDQPPRFSRKEYTASIVEDIPLSPPSPILQVVASDGDTGDNAAVRYSLLSGPHTASFRLHPETGFLYPAERVSAESGALSLTAVATDGMYNDTATVKVTVLAANQDKPSFVHPMTDNKVFYVTENSQPAGSLVLTARAEDLDSGENGRVSYFFRVNETVDSETERFTIDSETGEVRTKARFDRESRDEYTLVLVARDHGSPISHEAVRHVRVHVRDEDDHVPQFPEHVHRFSVTENAPAGIRVGSVHADDPDTAETGRTFYFPAGGDRDVISVGQQNGHITVARPLDREERQHYELIVKATSNASFYAENVTADDLDPTMTLVKVTVLDQNDSPPTFAMKDYFAGVSEDAQFRDPVVTVEATDPDQGENARLVYSIRSTQLYKPGAVEPSGAIVPSPFAVDTSGRLTCAALMGEYKQHRFVVKLTAREALPPHRQADCTVHIWVYDRSQLVHVTLGVPPDTIVRQPADVVEAFSNVTGGRVVIDDVRYHVTEENIVKRTWSDMYLHVADGRQQIVPTDEVLRAFDLHYDFLQRQHGALNLQKVQAADAAPAASETNQTVVALAALLLVLVVGLVTFCAVCCCLRTVPVSVPAYKEQVKRPPAPVTPRAAVDPSPETPPGTENPLWIGNKLKMYEEQELSMQVVSDPEVPGSPGEDGAAPTPEGDGHNTYATIQRPGEPAEHSPGADTADYATLGRYTAPTMPLGPTIPGVVPARERLPGVPPPPQRAANQGGATAVGGDNRHRRLSVGRDGRPELVSELQ